MADRLGVLAGAGELPLRVVAAARARSRPVFVLAFEGIADPAVVADVPHAWVRLGAVGDGLRLLRDNGVVDLVMAGAVRRPTLATLRPDWRAAKFFARAGLNALGDDGFLRAVIAGLEEEGFRVLSLDEFLGDTFALAGVLGAVAPDEVAQADIARGLEVALALGALDIGQAVVVQQGLVLGVEAIDGTDALIARCAALRRDGLGGVLVKIAKPRQERRADLPTIGPRTVEAVAASGLRGIAVEARSTLLLDRAALVAAADAARIFVTGIAMP